jgi:DNA-binding response OmpR family regulator
MAMADAKTKRKKTLLIDDEADFLEIMEEHLESWGYDVIKAQSGDEAMKAVSQSAPDAIILDFVMPDIDGVALLRKIRRINKDVPVIMFTAKPDAKAIKESEELNIAAFVPKLSPYIDTQKSLKSALSMALKAR